MLKLVTFNIRCDYNQDGNNSFVYRKEVIRKKIQETKPDVICFQEVLLHVAQWLKEELTEYYVAGCGRSAVLDNEQMTVAFRKDRLNLIAMDTFWLSETCYEPGSRYEEQSECPRVCTEMVLEDMEVHKAFRLVNVHLDHLGAKARILGLKQIIEKMEKEKFLPRIPIILAGDFNGEPDSEEIRQMERYPDYVNATEGIGITFHGFAGLEAPQIIDYIYIRNTEESTLKSMHIEKWEDQKNGVWLSDHYPICVSLEWELKKDKEDA